MSVFPGNARNEQVNPNDAERIEASNANQETKVYAARKLAKFFEIDVTLKIFGNVVFEWHFPPQVKPKK